MYKVVIASAIVLLGITGYLFYFADCATVKKYGYLVQSPARCIHIEQKIEPEMCLQGIYPAGQSFQLSENNAGQYRYEIYATSRGIEVWGACGKIE